MQEVAADDEHILDGTPHQVELHAGDGIKPLIFYNARKPGIHLKGHSSIFRNQVGAAGIS